MIEAVAMWIGFAVIAVVAAFFAWLFWEVAIWSLICACSNARFILACNRKVGRRASFLVFAGIVWRVWPKFIGFRKGSRTTSCRSGGRWEGVGDWHVGGDEE